MATQTKRNLWINMMFIGILVPVLYVHAHIIEGECSEYACINPTFSSGTQTITATGSTGGIIAQADTTDRGWQSSDNGWELFRRRADGSWDRIDRGFGTTYASQTWYQPWSYTVHAGSTYRLDIWSSSTYQTGDDDPPWDVVHTDTHTWTARQPLAATCSVSPTAITTGEQAVWSAVASGGSGSYAYTWADTSTNDGANTFGSGATPSWTKTYTKAGTAGTVVGASVALIDSESKTTSANCSNSVVVSPPPPPPPTPVNGVCSTTTIESCTAGDYVNTPADTQTSYQWTCNGKDGGSNSPTCTAPIPAGPVDGECSNPLVNFTCKTGTPARPPNDTSNDFKWKCDGLRGGSPSQACSLPKTTTVNGACSSPLVQWNCASPAASTNKTGTSAATGYTWTCPGSGTSVGTSASCSIAAAPPGTFTLTITKTGSGTGTVNDNPTTNISCGSTCSHSYASGAQVSLVAGASGQSTFTSWSGGGCSGNSGCVVTMDASKTVTAQFDLQGGGLGSFTMQSTAGSCSAVTTTWTQSTGAWSYGLYRYWDHNNNGIIGEGPPDLLGSGTLLPEEYAGSSCFGAATRTFTNTDLLEQRLYRHYIGAYASHGLADCDGDFINATPSFREVTTPACRIDGDPPTVDFKIRKMPVGGQSNTASAVLALADGNWTPGPLSIQNGEDVQLKWTSDADSCSGTNFTTGSTHPPNGNTLYTHDGVIEPASGSITYTIQCFRGDLSTSKSIILSVSGTGDPTISANPTLVDYGNTSVVSWTLNGHTPATCSVTGTNGETTGPLRETYTSDTTSALYGETEYKILCTDDGSFATVKIRVRPKFQEI